MGKMKYLLFGLLLSFSLSDAYKILVVFPIQSPSHGILGDSMVKSLLDGGHEVTYITPFVSRQPNHPKLHIIDVTAVGKFFSDKMIDVKKIMSGEMDLQIVDNFYDIQLLLASKTLENENVQNMLKDRQITFDAVIAEYMLTDMHSAFQAVYPCPFIWFSAYEPHWMILNVMHGPLNPAYTSNYMKPRVVPYSFSGRVLELWNQIKGLYKHNYPFYNKELEVYNKAIAPIVKEQDRPLPDYNELRYNATLLMSISQVVVGSALPLPPSVVHVGGFHVDEPVKPLPEKMEKMKTFWLLCCVTLACSEAAKILVVFPMPARSHGNLGDGFVRHLLNAGHEVTYITPFPSKNPPAKLRTLDVSKNFELLPPSFGNIKNVMDKTGVSANPATMVAAIGTMMKETVLNEDVQKVLNDPQEHFDVVIAEWMFSEIFAGFATVFDCPLIWSSSVDPHWMILQLVDEATNPAYTVDARSSNSPPLNFLQRATELWTQVMIQFVKYVWLDGLQENMYTSLFAPIVEKRGRKLPTFDEARYNASLLLTNSYVTTSGAASLPQSHKFIGGYHIDDTVKTLPEDLKKLMDSAKDGVIYFSMGSNLKSKDFPDELKVNILKMFGSLKQTVLWKFEEVLQNLPKNVHILKWAPQQEILSHPNLAVFITHGGLLSTTEAIHFGVPIIGIPVFADQYMNVEKSVSKGFAQKVDLSYTMTDELKQKILEIVNNKRYAEKAKELSFIYHDRPVKPGQELVHWVNHVVNTRGAPHLRSPALGLPFYKKRYLDLAAVIAVILLAVYILLKRACTYFFSRVFSKKRQTGNKKKNN